MSKQALGMIEVVGLAAAVEAADAALKSADVNLVGYELSKGGGMVIIKLTGNVSSVNMAVEAAKIAASKVNKVCACRVIARTDEDLDKMIYTKETVGYKKQESVLEVEDVCEKLENAETEVEEDKQEEFNEEELNELSKEDEKEAELDSESEEELIGEAGEDIEQENDSEICNLCWDPECPRKKGDLRNTCIHYEDY